MRGNKFLNEPAIGAIMVTLTPPAAVPLVAKKSSQIGTTEPFEPPLPKKRGR